MNTTYQPGKLVSLRGRDWIVLPSNDPDLLVVKPLGGSDEEIAGIYLPLKILADQPKETVFLPPDKDDLGDISTARLLYDSARLAFRNGAGPFRSLAKLSFRPRSYQMVPLIMALRQELVRLLVADDVGVGKTIEALLVAKELLERRKIQRFAVICLPHLCEQWQHEIRDKLDLEAVIIRSNTQARLDRQIQGDTSVYDYYPFQVISIDFIKSDNRRDVFVEQCPELVIIDEAHTCARPAGASASQQQRYHLISRLAKKANQQMILLTATPHSGKPEEFHSLLGLLKQEFETLDLPTSNKNQRQELSRYFVQRKRGDVEKWMGEDTPFPTRDAFETDYSLTVGYRLFFEEILAFARQLIVVDPAKLGPRKVQYWTALALLRGVMSSPAAGVEMLNTRLASGEQRKISEQRAASGGNAANSERRAASGERRKCSEWRVETVFCSLPLAVLKPLTAHGSPLTARRFKAARRLKTAHCSPLFADDNPVRDTEFGFEGDNTPTQVIVQNDWSATQRQKLRTFAQQLSGLSGLQHDKKLFTAEKLLQQWLTAGFNPVIFCRYIATANYVGELLAPALKKKFPKLDIQVITSELPDDLRKQKIEEMGRSKLRVLVATDCLSEGINLQDQFTAILHYDLPWNPNRLEQREGRVDRFGQIAPEVKACLLYGADNPIDGIVLDVLLRKVREIKRSTGINVPFPADSQSIIDTITQALLINPDRKITQRRDQSQLAFDFGQFDEAEKAKINVTRKVDEAAEREKASRSIFAQHAIKAQEIEADLKEVDEAIGDPRAVEEFVTSALNNLFGVQVLKAGSREQGAASSENAENGEQGAASREQQTGSSEQRAVKTAGRSPLTAHRLSPLAAHSSPGCYRIVTANLPDQLRGILPAGETVSVSFISPTPEGYHYMGRNHRFVEQLCQVVMANTVSRVDKRAARTAVIRTRSVAMKTTIFLFRCRNVIEDRKGSQQVVAEEMILWGWRGTPQQKVFLDHAEARELLTSARASSDLSAPARLGFLENELKLLQSFTKEFDDVAAQQSQKLVDAHERFSSLMDGKRFQVVYPVLPMDLLGVYVLLPE